MSQHLFAGLRVRDFQAARQWYELLLGEPSFFPHDTEAVWTLAEDRSVYVVEHADGAGSSVVTIFLDDLDAQLAAIAARGLEHDEIETYPNDVRKAVYRDPDGNEIGFAGAQPNTASEKPATDEQQIRELIERWAEAAHTGDMDGVLADHAPDIVMFDVPPPDLGVRGIDAYRQTWPGFFKWQASGSVFEIESLEITAGTDVGVAFALLRCGTPADFERNPDLRLRLTVGLRKTESRWIVTHEHHSFADTTPADPSN